MRSGSTFRIRATRDVKFCVFKIVVIVKMKLVIINKIKRVMTQCSDSKGGCIKTDSGKQKEAKELHVKTI